MGGIAKHWIGLAVGGIFLAVALAVSLPSSRNAQAGQVCLSCFVVTPVATQRPEFSPDCNPGNTSGCPTGRQTAGDCTDWDPRCGSDPQAAATATPAPAGRSAGCNIGDPHNCPADQQGAAATSTPAPVAGSACDPIVDPRCGQGQQPAASCSPIDPRCRSNQPVAATATPAPETRQGCTITDPRCGSEPQAAVTPTPEPRPGCSIMDPRCP